MTTTSRRKVTKIATVSNPGSRFSFEASLSSRNLPLSLLLSLFPSLVLSFSLPLDLHTASGSRQGSLYLHSNLPGRPHSAIILFRSVSQLSRVPSNDRLPRACSRESEFSGSNYVTRRRVPSLTLRSRFEIVPSIFFAAISATINVGHTNVTSVLYP